MNGGARFGRWVTERAIGEGGWSLVHVARDGSGHEVALKQPRPDIPLDPWRVERFRREALAVRSLEHPAVVRLVEAGETDGRPWLAYELVAGARTLGQAFRERPRRERVRLVREAALGLAAAHARGIVHRDVKPENVLVDAEGRARVADFGLCAIAGLDPLTASNAIVGTPFHTAPELALEGRGATSPACDVWSLGVLLHVALTGAHPFERLSFYELIARPETGAPSPRARLPGLCAEVDATCRRALAMDPRGRFPDAGAFARALEGCLAPGAACLDNLPEPGPRASGLDPSSTASARARLSPAVPSIEGLTLGAPLGAGGMGAVFRAVDGFGREVAVKVLGRDALGSPERRARFRREAEIVARLRHPNVVGVHRAGEVDGRPYIVMDLVPGASLEERLGVAPLPVAEALRIGRDLALALAHVHACGILHRDVKPANVVIDAEGVPRLLDFGLAKVLDDAERLTLSRQIVGTATYMSPEQLAGEKVDERTDVYGLGATLYAALTGAPPHADAASLEALMVRRLESAPEAPSTRRPELTDAIDALLLRALAIAPAERYPTARALAEDLERVLSGRASAALETMRRGGRRRRGAWAVLALGLAAAALGCLALARGRPGSGRSVDPEAAQRAVATLLHSDRSLRDAPELEALEGELPPGTPPALVEELAALRGLVALVRSDVASARTGLARAAPCATAAARGLRGAVAAVASEGAVASALADLSAAIDAGVRPTELRRLRLRLRARAGIRAESAALECLNDVDHLPRSARGREEREARAEALIALGRVSDASECVTALDPPRPDLVRRVRLLDALRELSAGRASSAFARLEGQPGGDEPEAELLVARATSFALRGLAPIAAGRPTELATDTELGAALRIVGTLRPGSPLDPELDRCLVAILRSYARPTPGPVLLALGGIAPPSPELLWAVAIQTDGMAPRGIVAFRPTLERALALDCPAERRPKLATLLARALVEEKQAAHAAAVCTRELPTVPAGLERAELLEARARAHLAAAGFEAALADFDAARATCPELRRVLAGRATALLALGREDAALEVALDVIRDAPPRALLEATRIVWRLGRSRGRDAEVRSAVEALLEAEPELWAWWMRRALLHAERGDRAAALLDLETARLQRRARHASDALEGALDLESLRERVRRLDDTPGEDGD